MIPPVRGAWIPWLSPFTNAAALWLVDDTEQRVLVFRRSQPDAATFDVELELRTGDVLTSPQLPGFALPLEDLFRR
jgi:Uma2 family endonuclease